MTRGKQKSEDGVRLITKYPNRRLYDRTDSKYIPFAGLKKLINDGISFKVLDEKTNEDVTRIVLTQIISEESIDINQFFSEELLKQIIKFYGTPVGEVMGKYLERAMTDFVVIQNQLIENSEINIFNVLASDSIQKNQDYLNEIQKFFIMSFDGDSTTK